MRVSTKDQAIAVQKARLHAADCVKFYAEKVSAAKTERAELGKLLKRLEPGDVLMVTRLDVLARSTRDLLNILEMIAGAGAGFKSLDENLGRHHDSARPPDSHRRWGTGSVRARTDPRSYRRGKDAGKGQWSAFRPPA